MPAAEIQNHFISCSSMGPENDNRLFLWGACFLSEGHRSIVVKEVMNVRIETSQRVSYYNLYGWEFAGWWLEIYSFFIKDCAKNLFTTGLAQAAGSKIS
jgi:hypothetical protein